MRCAVAGKGGYASPMNLPDGEHGVTVNLHEDPTLRLRDQFVVPQKRRPLTGKTSYDLVVEINNLWGTSFGSFDPVIRSEQPNR